ncbi:MAG: hypothetical protein ABIJ47_06735 [Candidatus Bathyarchaeota archaeon]
MRRPTVGGDALYLPGYTKGDAVEEGYLYEAYVDDEGRLVDG